MSLIFSSRAFDTIAPARIRCTASANRLQRRHGPCRPLRPLADGAPAIGNARTALLNALFARREGGTFVLRFDDTDLERSKPEYADAIEADLAWLGIPPDIVVRQSDRFALYADAAERLKAMGRLYACLRDPGRARVPPQAPARPRPAAGLRPRRAAPHGGGEGGARGGGAAPALALPPRPSHRRMARPRARRVACRLRLAVGPGAGARRRQLSLHAALGRRRHRA